MDTFKIGLTFAGAVSGGAYTAGVVDFLVEALEAWYAAKEDASRKDVPRHEVSIEVITGTSAGSVTAALMLAALRDQVRHVRTAKDATQNPSGSLLFDTWVNGLDIASLLQDNDLKLKNNKVVSLLDSTMLETLGQQMITTVPVEFATYPKWLKKELRVILCTTNVHGVPYRIPMVGGGLGHDMWQHADYGQFVYGDDQPKTMESGVTWVHRRDRTDTNNSPGKLGWETLRDTALASSAFPIGLSPRLVKRAPAEFNARKWPIPKGPPECCAEQTIATPWDNEQHIADQEKFLSVDGGQANNESFELARQILAEVLCKHNDRDRLTVDRSVILLDPFLEPWDPQKYQGALAKANIGDGLPDLVGLLGPLLSSLRTQCRFKREELALAQDETVYSRFLLAPTRPVNGVDSHDSNALASGGLGAFAGFLDRSLRVHDYLLGRHNARTFLVEEFVLPVEHPLWKGQLASDTQGNLKQYLHADKDGTFASIIPVMEYLRKGDAAYPVWPTLPQAFVASLEGPVKRRLGQAISGLLEWNVDSWFKRTFLKMLWKLFGQGAAVDVALGAICCDLRKWGLIPGPVPPQGGKCPGCPYKK